MEQGELLVCGLVCFDQLDSHLIYTVHEGLVHHTKPALPKSALLVF